MKLMSMKWCGIMAAALLLAASGYAEDCGDCGGDGAVDGDCYWCHGDGWISSTMTFYELCNSCGGSGEVECGDCEGSGHEAGSGQNCYTCQGTGVDGMCAYCGGDGGLNEDSYDVVEP